MKRGNIYYATLNPVVGNEKGGLRPVLIIQNNVGNRHSPTVIVAAIKKKTDGDEKCTHVSFKVEGLSRSVTVMLEHLRTIDRSRLKTYVNTVEQQVLFEIDKALAFSVGLGEGREVLDE